MPRKTTKRKQFKAGKIKLPVQEPTRSTQEFIPKANAFKGNESLVEQVSLGIRENIPILLVGETGTGKTHLVRYLANRTNNGFRRVNHNGGTTVDDVAGRTLIGKDGTYWVDGVLVDAMRKGYWYFADELNAASPETLFKYHSLLDDDGYVVLEEKDGEIVRPHPNFRFIAAMNPSSSYVGTKELNTALLSRFMVVKVDFPPPKSEEEIIEKRTGVDSDVAKKLVKFASEIRTSQAKGNFSFILSTRDLLMWARLYKLQENYIYSAAVSILNKVSESEYNAIYDTLKLHFPSKKESNTPNETDNNNEEQTEQ